MRVQCTSKGALALFGGFATHLTLGTIYCFGNINTYMTSYLRQHVEPELKYSDMVFVLAMTTMGQGCFMTLSGTLERLVGVRPTVAVGCTIMTAGVGLTYFTIQISVTLTALTYGLMFGLGTALAYAPPMGVAMRHFPRHRGMANGVIVAGFGLGAFVFNQVQSAYVNPLNLPLGPDGYFHDDSVLRRVPSLFLLLASIYGLVQILAIILIDTNGPQESESEAGTLPLMDDDETDEDELINDENQPENLFEQGNNDEMIVVTRAEVVKTRVFWTLWATFILNTIPITYINTMYKAYGQTFIDNDHFLAFVGAFAAVFNACGRIAWGVAFDHSNYKLCMSALTLFLSALYGSLYFVPFLNSSLLFGLWIWLIFFCFSGTFVLIPTATAHCFGMNNSSKIYGLVMTGQAVGAPLALILTQWLAPKLGYFGTFGLIAGVCALSAINTIKNFKER